MSGSPITFKGQHLLNAIILISIVVLTYYLCSTQSPNLFWIFNCSFLLIGLIIIPIDADMPVVISMLNSYSGWAATGSVLLLKTLLAITGTSWFIRSYTFLYNVQRNE